MACLLGHNAVRRFPAQLAFALWFACMLPSPAHAAGPCDSYPETFSRQELTQLSRDLRGMLPALYFDVIGEVPITMAERADSEPRRILAPRSLISPFGIEIPHGFKRRTCRMILLSAALTTKVLDAPEQVQKTMGECMTAISNKTICMDLVLDAFLNPDDARLSPSQAYRDSLADYTESAFQYIMLHEMGHIVFSRGRPSIYGFASVDEEAGADLMAAFTMMLWGDPIYPVGLFLNTYSLLDPYTVWSREKHLPTVCRLQRVIELERRAGVRTRRALKWAVDWESFEASSHEMGQSFELGQIPLATADVCVAYSLPELTTIEGDLYQINDDILEANKLIRDWAPNFGSTELNPQYAGSLIRILRNQKTKHEFSRIFRSTLLAKFVSNEFYQFSMYCDNECFQSSMNGEDAVITRNSIEWFSNELIGELSKKTVPAELYGSYVGQTIRLSNITLQGRGFRQTASRALEFLTKYAPDSAETIGLEGVYNILFGDCLKGIELMKGLAVRIGRMPEGFEKININDNEESRQQNIELCKVARETTPSNR